MSKTFVDPLSQLDINQKFEKYMQTLHVYSTLKRRGNERFHVVSTWNKRGVFVGTLAITLLTEDHL